MLPHVGDPDPSARPSGAGDGTTRPRQPLDFDTRLPPLAVDRGVRETDIQDARRVSPGGLPSNLRDKPGTGLVLPTPVPAQVITSQSGQQLRPHSTSLNSTLPSPSLTNEASPASACPHGDFYGRPTGTVAESQPALASNSGTSVISTVHQLIAPTPHQVQPEPVQQASNQVRENHQLEHVPQPREQVNVPPPPVADSSQLRRPGNDETSDSEHRRKRSRRSHGDNDILETLSPALQQACWVLDQRVAQFNGYGAVPGVIEKARYRILRCACEIGDLFYIVLHRYFCLWSRDRRHAYAVFPIAPELIDSAFSLLLVVLRNNADMSEPHLIWLSDFPEFLSRVPSFHDVCLQVSEFLARFATRWPPLMADIQTRMYPLLAWEPRTLLRCASTELETILFTLSRRGLGVLDGPFAIELGKLFERDQIKERRLAEKKATQEALVLSRGDIAVRYRTLLAQARRRASQPAATAASASQATMSSTPAGSFSQQQQHPVPKPNPMMLPSQAQAQHQSPNQRPAEPQSGAATQSRNHVPRQQPGLGISTGNIDPRFVLQSNQPVAAGHTISQDPGHTHTNASPPPNSQAQLPSLRYPAHMVGGPPATYPPTIGSQPQAMQPRRHATWAQPSTLPSPRLPSPGDWQNHQRNTGTQPPPNHQNQPSVSSPNTQFLQPRVHGYQVQQTQPAMAAAGNFMPHPPPLQNLSPAGAPLQPVVRSQTPGFVQPSAQQFTTHVVPENEYPSNSHDWTSVQSSLHLAHLRSPERAPATPENTRYYQFFERFVVEPKVIPPQMGISTLEFSLDQENLSNIPETVTSSELPISRYFNGSQRYRLRLCQRDESQTSIDAATWAICRTYWPEHIHISFNEHPKLLRRRRHFHHDLPIELTDSLVCGKNTVKVSLPNYAPNIKQGTVYFMAVELIKTLNHDSIWSLVQNMPHIASGETRREVQRRLRPPDSDDIIVENDTLAVIVADPFSSQLFVCPVRGSNCKHLECIDLQNWLETRPSKPPRRATEPAMVDVWNCPICGMDARPPNLRIDDFFVEVRNKLLANNNGNVKKINISADGNWTPVEEPDDVEEAAPAPAPAPAKVETISLLGRGSTGPVVPETIILLDDD